MAEKKKDAKRTAKGKPLWADKKDDKAKPDKKGGKR